MTLSLRISRSGLALIKSFEGFRERATRLPDGRWVVGHGHVKSAREGVRVSPEDAEALLVYDLKPIEQGLEDLLFSPLNQNQHDAIVSFAFNISLGLFRDSEVLKRLNSGDQLGAAQSFDVWRKARINGQVCVVDALVRRRAIEKALFLEHPDGRATAATPLVAPQIDLGLKNITSPQSDIEHKEEASDIEGMTSAIERLLATGSPVSESLNSADIKSILNKDETTEEGVVLSAKKTTQKTTNTDDFDSTEPEEKNIVFIGESDDDVFSAIGAEVDEALSTDQNTEEKNSVAPEPINSAALAAQKVERLVANDHVTTEVGQSSVSSVVSVDEIVVEDKSSETNTEMKIEAANDGNESDDVDVVEISETPEEVLASLLSDHVQKQNVEVEKQATPSSGKTPQQAADAVATRLANIFEPDVLKLSEEVSSNDVEVSGVAANEAEKTAWNLSEELTDDALEEEIAAAMVSDNSARKAIPEDKEGYGFAELSMSKGSTLIDDTEIIEKSTLDNAYADQDEDQAYSSKMGKRLWLTALIASIGVILLGMADYYRKAQPGKIVSQSDIAYGPLMIAIGGVVFLMAGYFLVSRRETSSYD